MSKFESSAHYQTEYKGNLRHDEIETLIGLLEDLREKYTNLNNVLVCKKITDKLKDFDKIE